MEKRVPETDLEESVVKATTLTVGYGEDLALAQTAARHYLQALGRLAERPDQGVSLYVAVPFCAARCLCCDREVSIAQPTSVLDRYVDGLISESRNLVHRVGTGHDVLQLHLGGGSANELNESQLVRLVHELHGAWRLPADSEMSIECDPRRVSWAQLRLLRGLGFGRVAFGVLDLDEKVQQAIGRRQTPALVADACDLARDCEIECIDVTIMFGLPHQNEESWRSTLDRLVEIGPDRVTLERYRHRPGRAPAQCAIDAHALPDATACLGLAEMAANHLCDAGYRWIGANQFVLDTDQLALAFDEGQLHRNLISYTAAPPAPVLGLGAGAVGEIDGHLFRNDSALLGWHQKVHTGQPAVVQARLSSEREARRREAIERLMCELQLPVDSVRGGLEEGYERLAQHARNGLVNLLDDRIVVTSAGRHALQTLCSELEDDPCDCEDSSPMRWLS